MRSTSTFAAAAAAVVIALTSSNNNVVDASSSHNAIRRPSIPRRMDTSSQGALSDPVAERGLLDALFGKYNGRATWYGVGVTMGACGSWTSPGERAVALNIGLYGNENAQSGWCGKKLKITANGKTSIATVVDCCPTCPGNGDLDMSKTLFQDFAGLDAGIVGIKWSWVGAGDDDNESHSGNGNSASSHNNNNNNNDDDEEEKPKPKPKPKPTEKPKPKTTETKTKTKTKTSTSTTTTTTKSKSTATSTKSATKSKKPTKTEAPESNLANLGQVINGLTNMAKSGQM